MGLKLIKGTDGAYYRTWYAVQTINGKRTTRKLKTPLRGRIPLDEFGRFSLDLMGDEPFEASKKEAKEELAAENKRRKDGDDDSRRNAEALGVRTIRLADLAKENAKRRKYELVPGSDNYKYNKSVFDILDGFAAWVEKNPRKGKRCRLLTDVDADLVKAYYADISKGLAWQSFRKYAFTLKSIFKHFTGGAVANPFESVYTEYTGRKSEFGDKSEIAHKPPSAEQMRRVWECAGEFTNKPYLRRLAVIASCTGLRIGDCCKLTWDKVDLARGVIERVKTKKTGAVVSVPIFDYDEASANYHPLFGELRRELEAALAEREDGTEFVTPDAARIYAKNPSRIIDEGKVVFAKALAPTESVEDAHLVGEEKPRKTPAEILAAIEKAPWAESKRERIRRVYEMRVLGKAYAQIGEAVGKPKSTVSEDLASVEALTGETIRPSASGENSTSRIKTLLKATRIERGQGQRAACLYGWHSSRMFFVGVAFYEIGMDEAELIGITGHATVKMVRHYIETAGDAAVAAAKRKNAAKNYARARGNASQATHLVAEEAETGRLALPAPGATGGAAAVANAIQAILGDSSLTAEAKSAAVLALTNALNK